MAEIKGTNSSLTFKVTRQAPELIPPARPTPYETKKLSDVDTVRFFNLQAPFIQFYKNIPHSGPGVLDPAKVIKEAIAKALVPYYPLAGRLREAGRGKLVVECSGEGIMFIEADADVTLDEFGEPLHPPFPCFHDLLYNVPGSDRILHSPLLLIQVTRLKCGGFVLAIRMNHSMVDGHGLAQFLKAVAELARGAEVPSTSPVWERHLLSVANPSRGSSKSVDSYCGIGVKKDTAEGSIFDLEDMVSKSFFFGPSEIGSLRRSISGSEEAYTSFELIVAHIWRSREIAFERDSKEKAELRFAVNIRSRLNPPLPTGYYGNALASAIVETTVGELSENPLLYAAQLVKKSKESLISDAARRATKGRSPVCENYYGLLVSDHRYMGLDRLDFGWDKPVFGGYPRRGFAPEKAAFFTSCTPYKYLGKSGTLMTICLPRSAMNKFVNLVHLV